MIIEKSGFLLMAGTLAAGGVGGWLAHDSKMQHDRAAAPPAAEQVAPAPPTASVVVVDRTPPPPLCDDNVGTPEDCPAMGPADEGVCNNVAAKRCADFKAAFKPKVAAAAVSCLRHLKPNELCDPARVNLCGHSALMAACPDLPPPAPTAGGTELGNAPPPPPSAVTTACENIVKGCAGASVADCRQTLSGMTDAGRASITACMASHCTDKGLLGCEGLNKP
ncbi:MAG: hypothetical protein ABJB12_22035 [Pseudomonadota bacterium]